MPTTLYTPPTSFDASLSEAELFCFNYLVTATGSRQGHNAHLGHEGLAIDQFTFRFTTPIADAQHHHLLHGPINAMAYNARADLRYGRREDAQRVVMQILRGLPITYQANVVQFDVDTLGDLVPAFYIPPNEQRAFPVYNQAISFNVIFGTGGRCGPCIPCEEG